MFSFFRSAFSFIEVVTALAIASLVFVLLLGLEVSLVRGVSSATKRLDLLYSARCFFYDSRGADSKNNDDSKGALELKQGEHVFIYQTEIPKKESCLYGLSGLWLEKVMIKDGASKSRHFLDSIVEVRYLPLDEDDSKSEREA